MMVAGSGIPNSDAMCFSVPPVAAGCHPTPVPVDRAKAHVVLWPKSYLPQRVVPVYDQSSVANRSDHDPAISVGANILGLRPSTGIQFPGWPDMKNVRTGGDKQAGRVKPWSWTGRDQ